MEVTPSASGAPPAAAAGEPAGEALGRDLPDWPDLPDLPDDRIDNVDELVAEMGAEFDADATAPIERELNAPGAPWGGPGLPAEVPPGAPPPPPGAAAAPSRDSEEEVRARARDGGIGVQTPAVGMAGGASSSQATAAARPPAAAQPLADAAPPAGAAPPPRAGPAPHGGPRPSGIRFVYNSGLFGQSFSDEYPGLPPISGASVLLDHLKTFSDSLFDGCVLLWDPIPSRALPPGTQVVAVPEQPFLFQVPDLRNYPLGPQPLHFTASYTYWCDSHFWPAGQRYTTVAGTDPCKICVEMNTEIRKFISLQRDSVKGTASQVAKNPNLKDALVKCTEFGSSFLHHSWVKQRLKYVLERSRKGRVCKPGPVRQSRLKKGTDPGVRAHTLENEEVRASVECK